jgi:hypothetical protein
MTKLVILLRNYWSARKESRPLRLEVTGDDGQCQKVPVAQDQTQSDVGRSSAQMGLDHMSGDWSSPHSGGRSVAEAGGIRRANSAGVWLPRLL